jgi:hypothetical protein
MYTSLGFAEAWLGETWIQSPTLTLCNWHYLTSYCSCASLLSNRYCLKLAYFWPRVIYVVCVHETNASGPPLLSGANVLEGTWITVAMPPFATLLFGK